MTTAEVSRNAQTGVVIQSEFDQGAPWPAHLPLMWKALVKVLAPLGRLLGYEAC